MVIASLSLKKLLRCLVDIKSNTTFFKTENSFNYLDIFIIIESEKSSLQFKLGTSRIIQIWNDGSSFKTWIPIDKILVIKFDRTSFVRIVFLIQPFEYRTEAETALILISYEISQRYW